MKIKDLDSKMVERICEMLVRTWEIIAYDCFINDLGEKDHSIVYSREEVFQMACDAPLDIYHEDKEAYEIFRSLTDSYKEINDFFAPKTFPMKKYGW